MDTDDKTMKNEIHRLQEHILLLEQNDKLTGLMHNTVYLKKVDALLAEHPDWEFSLIYFSIKNLKLMNIQQGTHYGDRFLCHIASYLRLPQEKDVPILVSRVYADAFSVFLPSSEEKSMTTQIFLAYSDFSRTMAPPSIGIRHVKGTETAAHSLLNQAYMAASSIYDIDDRHVVVYGDSMYNNFVLEQIILSDFKTALEHHDFLLYFQPKYNIASGKIIGAEALVRWDHPTAGFISPGKFIPVLEQYNLIQELDCYIWESLCRHLHQWNKKGYPPIPVSVNASRISIGSLDVAAILEGLVKKYHLSPSQLEVEITESVYAEHPDSIKNTIDKLHQAGFVVLMDDFGSGYSSLSFLADTNVDVIKLDMRFLNCDTPKSNYILSSVIRISYWLNLRIIAEGVENQKQADTLLKIGCFYAQGFLFCKPIPSCEYEKLLPGNFLDVTDMGAQKGKLNGLVSTLDLFSQNMINEQITELLLGAVVVFSLKESSLSILNVNKAFCALLRSQDVPCPGDDLLSLLKLRHPDVFLAVCRRTARLNPSDGRTTYIQAGKNPRLYKAELYCLSVKPDSAILYAKISDASELYHSLNNARLCRQGLQVVMDSPGLPFFELDIKSHIATCSALACRLLGLTSRPLHAPEGFLEQGIICEDHKAEFCRFFLSVYIKKQDISCRLAIRLADGARVNARLSVFTLRDSGRIQNAIGTLELEENRTGHSFHS